jgi:hypothetical protein
MLRTIHTHTVTLVLSLSLSLPLEVQRMCMEVGISAKKTGARGSHVGVRVCRWRMSGKERRAFESRRASRWTLSISRKALMSQSSRTNSSRYTLSLSLARARSLSRSLCMYVHTCYVLIKPPIPYIKSSRCKRLRVYICSNFTS